MWRSSDSRHKAKLIQGHLSGGIGRVSLQHLSHMCWECQQKQCQYKWNGEGYKKFHLFPCWLQLTRNQIFCHCQKRAGKHLLTNTDIVLGVFFSPATDLSFTNWKPGRDLDFRYSLMPESLAFSFQWCLHDKPHLVCEVFALSVCCFQANLLLSSKQMTEQQFLSFAVALFSSLL